MIATALVAVALALAPQSARVDDVRLAAQHLREDHPNLFHDLAPATFDAAVSDLESRADSLNDDELLVGLMQIAALPGVRDGHTGIFPLDPDHRRILHAYPIRLFTFSDAALLFQNGRQDPISPPQDVDLLVRTAGGAKEQRWYDAPHELNGQAHDDSDAWLVRLLGP
jgi:hypothetical protein